VRRSVTMALSLAGMLNAIGVDSQVYAPSLSNHWPSCMQEAATWPILELPRLEQGVWHLPRKHVLQAYALAANVPAICRVFKAAGLPQQRLQGMEVGPESAVEPFNVFGQPRLSRRLDGPPSAVEPVRRQRSRSPWLRH
jgi:hypothetical protein